MAKTECQRCHSFGFVMYGEHLRAIPKIGDQKSKDVWSETAKTAFACPWCDKPAGHRPIPNKDAYLANWASRHQ